MVGLNDKDRKQMMDERTHYLEACADHRHQMLMAYMMTFAEQTGFPPNEVELREFKKSTFEMTYRFVTRSTTNQQTVTAIRKILNELDTVEGRVEKLATLFGIEDYD